MKNFNINIIKQITNSALPKKSVRRLRKAKKEYKNIKKIIYSAAKHGNFSTYINFFPTEPEVNEWLEQDGFQIEYLEPFLSRISWD